jgi:flagellar hook-length control protein FliK
MGSWPQSGQPDLALTQAAPQPPSSQDLQASSNPTPTLGRTGQAAPASGPESSDPSSPPSATDQPELADFSILLGKFAAAETSIKVSGNETQQAPDRLTTGSVAEAVGAQSSGLGKTAIDSVQNPVAPKSENLMNNPAKADIPSALVSGTVTVETTWQKGHESEAASANPPLSSSASTVTPQQFDAHSQPAAPAPTLQKEAAPEATSIQSKGAVSASSGGSAGHANLADSSTSGQGKSGQQSGLGSGDNPAGVATFAPIHTTSPAPDPAGNLLTAHAPSVPANHTTTSAPQTVPSSTQPASTLAAWQNYDGGAGKIVRSASISDSGNGAEMHVELRSGALGPLEIHTVVREGSVGAEIHVQGQEAHTLLAAGLPSLERALGERNLRVENITVYQDQAGGGMSGGTKQDSQSGSSPSPHSQALPWNNPPQSRSAVSGSSDEEELANPAAGLSVRA